MNTRVGRITLTDSQQRALDRLLAFLTSHRQRIFILKGYAGTGKTTMVKAIINELIEKGCEYTLLASTGRAAKVLSDTTMPLVSDNDGVDNDIIASVCTIHSHIYTFSDINQNLDLFDQNNEKSEIGTTKGIKLQFTLKHREDDSNEMIYIVDESSMISDAKDRSMSQAIYGTDGRLLKDLLEYDKNGKFIFIGDSCQLPPINQSFSPALNADYFKNTFGLTACESELTEVMRQANGNDITLSASRIRKLFFSETVEKIARFPFRGYKNIHILRNEYELLNMYIDCIKSKDYSKATMIVMSNKTATNISNIVRPSLGFRERTISIGDLLLVTQNNMVSGLINGDLVKIRQVGRREQRAGMTFVLVEVESVSNGMIYSQLLIEDILYSGCTNISQEQQTNLFIDYHYRMKEQGIKQRSEIYRKGMQNDQYLNALRCVFGYALTCHKAQGGEWDKVFLIIPRGLPYNNPQSYAYQWVYTAMTRARKDLYVIDDYWICN